MIFLMRQIDPGHDATAGGSMPERAPAHPLNPRLRNPGSKARRSKALASSGWSVLLSPGRQRPTREKYREIEKSFFAHSLKGTCRVFPPFGIGSATVRWMMGQTFGLGFLRLRELEQERLRQVIERSAADEED